MPISRDSLLSLEAYAKARPALRAEIIEHKKRRVVHLGNHVTLLFEDEKTLRYQVQEMLRAEKFSGKRAYRMNSTPTTRWCPMAPTSRRRCSAICVKRRSLGVRKSNPRQQASARPCE